MKSINELKNDHHFQVSIVKSAFRLMACVTMVLVQADGIAAAGLMLAVAELLGIGEELV